jgi:hypothetical protein
VREEMHHVREGKHGARSTKQAIAIGLSKARRSGVKLRKPPSSAKARTRKSAEYATRAGRRSPAAKPRSPRRARAVRRALKPEGRSAASATALSRQATSAARRRSAASRSRAQGGTNQRTRSTPRGGSPGGRHAKTQDCNTPHTRGRVAVGDRRTRRDRVADGLWFARRTRRDRSV